MRSACDVQKGFIHRYALNERGVSGEYLESLGRNLAVNAHARFYEDSVRALLVCGPAWHGGAHTEFTRLI